jgi:hypothetical protein
LVTVLAEVLVVPFRYAVDDVVVTVTFWPAEVVRVRPDDVTLSTVPAAPPSAAADRALLPLPPPAPPPGPGRCPVEAGAVLVAEGDDVEGDEVDEVEQPATSPAAATAAPTEIHIRFLFMRALHSLGLLAPSVPTVLGSFL